jgi:hypothetical protein
MKAAMRSEHSKVLPFYHRSAWSPKYTVLLGSMLSVYPVGMETDVGSDRAVPLLHGLEATSFQPIKPSTQMTLATFEV